MRVVVACLLAFLFSTPASASQFLSADTTVVEDYRPVWQIFNGQQYEPYTGQDVKAIYFQITQRSQPGDKLKIVSSHVFSIWIQSRLVLADQRDEVKLNLDSLLTKYPPPVTIGVYVVNGVEELITQRTSTARVSNELRPWLRQPGGFRDFCILGSVLLFVFFLVLWRANPKLMFDYVNVAGVFTIRERDDNLQATRITSSINILFLVFCCMLCAIALLISREYLAASASGIAQYIGRWLLYTLIFFACFTLKFLLNVMWAAIFLMQEFASFQFFHFVRMLILSCGAVALAGLIFYGFGISAAGIFINLLPVAISGLALGVILLFLKLMGRTSQTLFHLFFYLCASEIFPLIVLVKVFLY